MNYCAHRTITVIVETIYFHELTVLILFLTDINSQSAKVKKINQLIKIIFRIIYYKQHTIFQGFMSNHSNHKIIHSHYTMKYKHTDFCCHDFIMVKKNHNQQQIYNSIYNVNEVNEIMEIARKVG